MTMQTRLNQLRWDMHRHSSHQNRVSVEVAFSSLILKCPRHFSVSVPRVVAIFANALFVVAYCLAVTTTPVFAKQVEEKGKGIVNKQVRSLQSQLSVVVHRLAFDSSSPATRARFLYPLTNIRISPLINRGYRMNAYRAQFLIRALLIRSEIWELCCCLISDPPILMLLLATDTKVTDTSVIALLQTCFLVLTFSLRVPAIDKITRIPLLRSMEDGKVYEVWRNSWYLVYFVPSVISLDALEIDIRWNWTFSSRKESYGI